MSASSSIPVVSACVALMFLCGDWSSNPVVAADAGKDPVSERLSATVAALRTEGVKLTAADFHATSSDDPPRAVTEAGPEFVEVWREYRRASSLKRSLKPETRDLMKNVLEHEDEYSRLWRALLDGPAPPKPEQVARFYFNDYGWCGQDVEAFAQANRRATLLACLQNRQWGDAVAMVLSSTGVDSFGADLLTALGMDWRKVVAGAWLDGKYRMLERLCKDPSDATAQLVIHWAELHCDEMVARRESVSRGYTTDSVMTPEYPALELLHLLAPGKDVQPQTKERIAAFLHHNATRLYDARQWLQRPPLGTASSLKPIARAALQHERNDVRQLAERVLYEAGETDAKAEVRPSAQFRLFINRNLWAPSGSAESSARLGFSVRYGPAGSPQGIATGVQVGRDGLITVNRDHFSWAGTVREASLDLRPSSFDHAASPEDPWVRAMIPLPPAYGAITDLKVETVSVTVAPRFPRPIREYANAVTTIEFTPADDDREPGASSPFYQIKGRGPLVLQAVQPGGYWLRVRASGAALTRWEKVEITKSRRRFEPKLEVGASISIPLHWPDDQQLGALDPEIVGVFRRSWWAGFPEFFAVEPKGTALKFEKSQPLGNRTTPDVLTLRNLPVGKYRVRLRSSTEVRDELTRTPAPAGLYAGWSAIEIPFEVNARSPHDITLPPLVVQLTR